MSGAFTSASAGHRRRPRGEREERRTGGGGGGAATGHAALAEAAQRTMHVFCRSSARFSPTWRTGSRPQVVRALRRYGALGVEAVGASRNRPRADDAQICGILTRRCPRSWRPPIRRRAGGAGPASKSRCARDGCGCRSSKTPRAAPVRRGKGAVRVERRARRQRRWCSRASTTEGDGGGGAGVVGKRVCDPSALTSHAAMTTSPQTL